MDIDTSDKREQRKFGIVIAVGITVLGMIRWALHRDGLPWVFFAIAAVFLVLG
ncbi:MAG: hypothetical protein QG656_266, partial [Candidatus Hydrogenedentes bacterium]|nr:hypothetical protein [Candidatus Hydrogenedentota bacterium]